MREARLITIGTEITCGEVVNTNAAWVSSRLEELGVRVYSHLSVRDQREEILKALATSEPGDIVVVTGGLGPTSDDITRECMAFYCGRALEFDDSVYQQFVSYYQKRGLPLREAHKHQCYFPQGSERLSNPVGTALGFAFDSDRRQWFVLPGPPRELEGMWMAEVEPRLKSSLPPTQLQWMRWTCLGVPESEVAELVEGVIAGQGFEVGYRAQTPYVKVKLYADPNVHDGVIAATEKVLQPYLVGRGFQDLADELLERWPAQELQIYDEVTSSALITRLLKAKCSTGPRLGLLTTLPAVASHGITVTPVKGDLLTELRLPSGLIREQRTLPYKVELFSERGMRSAAEWAIWSAVKALRSQSSTSA